MSIVVNIYYSAKMVLRKRICKGDDFKRYVDAIENEAGNIKM